MDLNSRIQTFIALGEIMACFPGASTDNLPHPLTETALRAEMENPWFTKPNISYAIQTTGRSLSAGNLNRWLFPYLDLLNRPGSASKTIGVVMAGNIPLVGFHDFLSVLVCGHRFAGKLSAQDAVLLPAIASLLIETDERWQEQIVFTTSPFRNFDAIIATGSNNTFRYFDYYFGRYPHLIRNNRNGVAILTGEETSDDLSGLSADIMRYFGLGCRNVSKIYIPYGYDLNILQPYLREYKELEYHNKYRNNYDYQKSILLVNNRPFVDFGNLILVEDKRIPSPVSLVHFERYRDIRKLALEIATFTDRIQCVICHNDPGISFITPGSSQQPCLWDYADGVDTLKFLLQEI
jgi:hypothetical protein